MDGAIYREEKRIKCALKMWRIPQKRNVTYDLPIINLRGMIRETCSLYESTSSSIQDRRESLNATYSSLPMARVYREVKPCQKSATTKPKFTPESLDFIDQCSNLTPENVLNMTSAKRSR